MKKKIAEIIYKKINRIDANIYSSASTYRNMKLEYIILLLLYIIYYVIYIL